ncbi:hypothetical protein Q5752_002177 [Cryptotrichosporon argae]
MNGFVASGPPPPAYERVIRRVYPHSLRFVTMFTALVGLLWGVSLGVQNLKYRNDDDETSKEKLFDILIAIFYFVIAVIEATAMLVCFLNRMPAGRLLLILAPLGVSMLFAAQVLAVVEHFVAKTDLITQCADSYLNDTVIDDLVNNSPVTLAEATSECTSSWDHQTVTVIAWLIVGTIIGHADEAATDGYVIPNAEEDEAWSRARAEGVTAHLTGGGASQKREGEV